MSLEKDLAHCVAERILKIKPLYPHLAEFDPEKAVCGSFIDYQYQVDMISNPDYNELMKKEREYDVVKPVRMRVVIPETIPVYQKQNSILLHIEFYDTNEMTQRVRPPAAENFGPISAEFTLNGKQIDKIGDAILSILADEKKRFLSLNPDVSNIFLELDMTTFTANKNYDEVLKLLKMGVTANSHNQAGTSVLYIASEAGDLRLARLLVEWGADLDWIDLNSRKTALQIAKEKNHTEVVKYLEMVKK